ncbi:PGPGW domain-containing protein [Nocardioides sp.]|jgi:hypothetical protein|uniref:PGPGW domain-containing protein n=1 Tax=Nocardioides sp. TaxID=35761 RepID=UPI00261CC00E|nr:PGPGW domain-containing protein [Nocardioides sp.]
MRRLLLSSTGWLLVLLGIVLYPLPGPGLLVLVLGLALLGRHDPWAAQRLAPLRHRALVETRRSVATWPRTLVTGALTVGLGASGLLWLADPAQPTWWPLPAWTWLPGGTWTGVGQVGSGLVGLAIVAWARVRLGPGTGTPDSELRAASGS